MPGDIQIAGSDITTVADEGQFWRRRYHLMGPAPHCCIYLVNSMFLFGDMRDLRDVVS